ncbi:uncharacterized protein B0H18DRAFT_820217, partial [Fomitopsis serialis]|uniref:uncharacterized protein n=1 Tax=Fomitopsis serialis TaxID=139415 RepID=UPI0020080782
PFDDPEADFILRSSDRIDFRVSRFILRVSSDFFATMFVAGQAENEENRDGCPIVPMHEDSETLDSLLRIIYPKKAPILDDLAKIHAVLAAALKFDMEKPIDVVGATLCSFIPNEPLRVWAIAVRNRLEPEARAAADEIVCQVDLSVFNFPPEMQHISAGAYYRLLRY